MYLLECRLELDVKYDLEVKKYDFIYNMMRYLIGVKSGITYVISQYYAKIKVDSYDSLPLEKKV